MRSDDNRILYTIDEDLSKRINILKYFFIILVVYSHSTALPKFSFEFIVPAWVETFKTSVHDLVASLCVPGFFILSSFLLYSKRFNWVKNAKKKAISIGIPYFLINLFWLLFFKGMSLIPAVAPMFSAKPYNISSWGDVWYSFFGSVPLYYPFWFLHDLFILNMVAGIFGFITSKYPVFTTVGLGIVTLVIYFLPIPIPLLATKYSLLYWVVGIIVARSGLDLKYFDRTNKLFWYILSIVLSIVFLVFTNRYTQCAYVVSAFILCYILSRKVVGSSIEKFWLKCSKYTFFVYAFHEYYEAMIKKAIMTVLPQPGIVQLLEFLILPAAIIAVCTYLGSVVSRRWPAFYGIITSGKLPSEHLRKGSK